MSAAGKALQMVRPHVKSISFPKRSGTIPKWTGQAVAPASAPSPIITPMTLKSPTPTAWEGDTLPIPPWPQVGTAPRGTGIAFGDLPARYKRKALSDEEIDSILSGGS